MFKNKRFLQTDTSLTNTKLYLLRKDCDEKEKNNIDGGESFLTFRCFRFIFVIALDFCKFLRVIHV